MRRLPILLLVLLASACRDGAVPFSLPPFSGDSTGRLTYNVNGDHTPTWSTSADSVYFAAWSYPSLPATKGILLGLPRKGGVVSPILPAVQVGLAKQPWLTAPALNTDGSRIAFFEMTDVRDKEFDYITCPMPPLSPVKDTIASNSFLRAALLRIRKTNSSSASDDAQIPVTFAGRVYDPNLPGAITNIAYPFQRLFDGEGLPFFRASWSPDGNQVVFSDGTSLRLWTVGAAASTVIANTDDGILPAWSPDGSWIAFSKPFKGTTQSFGCQAFFNGASLPAAIFSRTVYTPLTREGAQLFVIHADGTGLKGLGEGEGPAWLPDSKTIIAHRSGSLYRIAFDTGAGTIIPSTLEAFEPAVSRDGKYLTFARRKEVGIGAGELNSKGQYNIWVAAF